MKVREVFSYRNLRHKWVSELKNSLEEIPEDIFFEKDRFPLKREIIQLDKKLFKLLNPKFGLDVEQNFAPMVPESRFTVDLFLPTKPATLIEIEKGKLPRFELDMMKMLNSICRFPSEYGFVCIIAPVNYIKLNLAGRRSPYRYLKNKLVPLNSPLLDLKSKSGTFLIKDFLVVGYFDPRGK